MKWITDKEIKKMIKYGELNIGLIPLTKWDRFIKWIKELIKKHRR